MPGSALAVLIVIFFVTSMIGVVTGSNSLISVPAMFQFGVEPRVAVATNMFGLVFMAIGGSIPFVRAGKVDLKRLSPLLAVTLVGSAIGAAIVGAISDNSMKWIVTAAIVVVSLFILTVRTRDTSRPATWMTAATGITLTFVLGIYGGLFSGGYVTILTAVLVAFYGLSFTEAIGATKIINVVSSSIAAAVFMWQGLVDYRLGVILGAAMFVGGYVGAHFASKMSERWLRAIFFSAVLLLTVMTVLDLIKEL
ncbi:MAG: sulfite exporter TauE/SafE family protein [Pyrinomonadaceae bacterium]|nr:sulfite exporter TauE/SafE family protein [Pyrinomonadaceae bacterium]